MTSDSFEDRPVSRRTVLRTGAALSAALGVGLAVGPGHVAAMNKAELIEAMASEAGLSKADSKRALDAFVGTTTEALAKGDRVTLVGFGSFSISKRSARTGRNPERERGGEKPPTEPVDFEPSRELAAALDLIPGKGDERRRTARRRGYRRDRADAGRGGLTITVERLARDSGLSKADAKRALDAFINTTTKALKKGDRLSLVGFGSFSISKRSARTGRNPQTGKEIKIPAKNVVKFKAGAELSKAVN
jgi:nucleoid DNA-binding protein